MPADRDTGSQLSDSDDIREGEGREGRGGQLGHLEGPPGDGGIVAGHRDAPIRLARCRASVLRRRVAGRPHERRVRPGRRTVPEQRKRGEVRGRRLGAEDTSGRDRRWNLRCAGHSFAGRAQASAGRGRIPDVAVGR
jgi:hypothetical protein